MTRDSIGGAVQRVAPASVGSSPTPATKKRLRKMLRARDKKISILNRGNWWRGERYIFARKTTETIEKLDKERKEIRLKLKAYEVVHC